MRGKLSPIIIIVLIVVILAVGALIISTIFGNDSNNTNKGGFGKPKVEEPIITLNKEVKENNGTIVDITVNASTESGEEILEIILPNGTSVPGGTAIYTVTENGKYKFMATSKSGGNATSEIEVTEIPVISATNPYVPEGFSVISDNIEEGFVISDQYGNQYVWIPVETGKLTRKTMLNANYEESCGTASALVNSVAKYYGFYIGKFEASQYEHEGEITAASMEGKIPWTNVIHLDAKLSAENSGKVFGYTDCNTALLNSYAWDTTMEWIDLANTHYSSDVNFGNYSGTIYPTGTTTSDIVRNICDLAGNVREWTTEHYKGNENNYGNTYPSYRVVRGGSANLKRTPISHIYYPENTSDNYWGFRLILYK